MGAKAWSVIRNEGMEIITASLEAKLDKPNTLSLVGLGNLYPREPAGWLAGI